MDDALCESIGFLIVQYFLFFFFPKKLSLKSKMDGEEIYTDLFVDKIEKRLSVWGMTSSHLI